MLIYRIRAAAGRWLQKHSLLLEWIMILVQLTLLVGVCSVMINADVFQSIPMAVNSFMYLAVLLLDLVLFVSCDVGGHTNLLTKLIFELMLFSAYVSIATAAFAYFYNGHPEHTTGIYISSTVSYCLLVVMLGLYWLYYKNTLPMNQKTPILDAIEVVMMLVGLGFAISNPFTGVFFTVSEDGYYVYSRYNWISYEALIIYCAMLLLYVIRVRAPFRQKFPYVIYVQFPIVSIVISYIWEMAGIPYDLESLYSFCWVMALLAVFMSTYSQRGRIIAEQEKELVESRLNAMIMQINPHFVYNTLGSIASLCASDPKEAERLIYQFSDYLRNNESTLVERPMIPFEEEMKHLEAFLSIQKVRFPNITVEYDLQTTRFFLPGLSVQPLVENAIRHGICKRRKSEGTVTISSRENEKEYIVTVKDNGVGFASLPEDNGKHLGISNVRSRLAALCNGSLTVHSIPETGTVCTIIIPKEGEE